jgi:membrane-bound metal-dependent hydrolase YbcI (DUF457 family)
MFLWHVGATTAFIRYAFRDPNMDLRFLALGAIAPDLIDLPIGIALWSRFQSPRLAAHTLVFGALCMAIVLVFTRRGGNRKRGMLFAVGILLHLLLDAMWRQPETLWWPFLGWDFAATPFATYGAYVADLVRNPVMWAGELVGLTYLIILFRKSALGGRDERRTLYTTGRVSARIGRT